MFGVAVGVAGVVGTVLLPGALGDTVALAADTGVALGVIFPVVLCAVESWAAASAAINPRATGVLRSLQPCRERA